MDASSLQLIILPAGIIAILFAIYLARDVPARDTGTVAMPEVARAMYEAAVAETDIFGPDLGFRTGFAFLVGAACSMASGIIGMFIAVKANVRTASAARRSLVEAVQVAMRGGAVSGFLVVALSLLGVYGIFAAFGGLSNPNEAPFLIVGFRFGPSFV